MSSSAERSTKFREKLKDDKERLEAYRKKDRERKAKQHAQLKTTMSKKEKVLHKLKRAELQRCWRAKKKSQGKCEGVKKESGATGDYKSPQSLGKAVKRVQKHLPKSPSKVPHVIAKVVEGMSPGKRRSVLEVCDSAVKRRKLQEETRKQRSDALSDESIKEIQEFYVRDDVSRMCPGRKECVSVKTPTGRELRQKRFLLFNIAEVYAMFKAESQTEVNVSKFASLRPPQVVPITLKDHEVCMCKYHENIELLLSGIRNTIPTAPKTAEDLLCKTVCSTLNVKCMDRECKECDVEGPVSELFDKCDEDLSYYQWVTTDDGRVRKVQVTCTVSEAKEDLTAQLHPFGRHVYNIKRQYNELRFLKGSLQAGEIIIHEDFAENFALKHQHEIMSAHWHNETVTVFTAVVYFKPDSEGELLHKSYAVVSNEMSHDKSCVYTCNSAILEDVKQLTEVKKVHYWTDGAGSQFKNRYNLSTILYHEEEFACEATWSFFETAHGKGPCDGIGAEVKRVVWRAILQANAVVTTAKEFFDTAQRLCKKIALLYCSEEQVQEATKKLTERWSNCKAIPHTHSIHYVDRVDDSTVRIAKNSQFSQCDGCVEHILMPKSSVADLETPSRSGQDVNAQEPGTSQQHASGSHSFNQAASYGLPPQLSARLRNPAQFTSFPHKALLVSRILDGKVSFRGNGIISPSDLSSLQGGHVKPEDNFLVNFVIDAYLQIVQTAAPNIVVIPWEQFEKSKRQPTSKGKLLEQDIIIAPCNPVSSKHWFMLVVLPKEKLVVTLDSCAGAFVKPPAEAAMQKMWKILKRADNSLDASLWNFISNKPEDIPQQSNVIDCGVFVCLYARCLVTGAPMLCQQADIPAFRQHMILELHYQALLSPSTNTIQKDAYYAVDYVNIYYIGRALDVSHSSPLIPFKFLHTVGAKRFDWPTRDDTDNVHHSCVFYGPITLQGNGPFEVLHLDELEAVYKQLRNRMAAAF